MISIPTQKRLLKQKKRLTQLSKHFNVIETVTYTIFDYLTIILRILKQKNRMTILSVIKLSVIDKSVIERNNK